MPGLLPPRVARARQPTPRTGTRDVTEFRAEIASRVSGSRCLPRSVAHRTATTTRRDTEGTGAGAKVRRQLPGQQQWGSEAANPIKGTVPGCTRRASLIRPPPVTSRCRVRRASFGLAAITRGDPLRIERVKEMYVRHRIPVNPPPQHNRDRRHTQGPGAAETARSRPLARYPPWWRSPVQGRHNGSRRRSIPMTTPRAHRGRDQLRPFVLELPVEYQGGSGA